MIKWFIVVLALVTLVAIFACVVWFMDPFVLVILGLAPLVWIGGPAVLVSGIYLLIAHLKNRSARPAWIILAAVAGWGGFVALAIPANHRVQARAVTEAKAYPARIEPLLETYRQTHGTFPANLDQLPAAPPPPRLFRKWSYKSDGTNYWFSFPQPGGLIDVWDYNGQTKTWHLST